MWRCASWAKKAKRRRRFRERRTRRFLCADENFRG
jgi:hypothetical protein